MNSFYLGLDTSNYTTSIAIVDRKGNIVEEKRIALIVKSGQKGLRQQEALFQHLKNIPELFEGMSTEILSLKGIGVTTRPRNIVGSYMPVFMAGENFGRVLSKAIKIPLKKFSHQEGHIGCCILGDDYDKEFLSVHLSGGTTEIVHTINKMDNLHTKLVGGTLDISMGQLVDRIGVYLGFDFPCGMELDLLAQNGGKIDKSIVIEEKNGWINLSGIENVFKKLLDEKQWRTEDIIFSLFDLLGDVVKELILKQLQDYPVKKVFIVGGVSANSIIREKIKNESFDVEIFFPDKRLSTDNAVGVAYLASCKKGWDK